MLLNSLGRLALGAKRFYLLNHGGISTEAVSTQVGRKILHAVPACLPFGNGLVFVAF